MIAADTSVGDAVQHIFAALSMDPYLLSIIDAVGAAADNNLTIPRADRDAIVRYIEGQGSYLIDPSDEDCPDEQFLADFETFKRLPVRTCSGH